MTVTTATKPRKARGCRPERGTPAGPAARAVVMVAAVVLLGGGCRPYAGSGGITSAIVTPLRGTITFMRVDPTTGEAMASRITPDGLVLSGLIARVRAGEGTLGEANPAEVGEVIGIASRDEFFSWEGTQPVGASPEARDRTVALVLAITAEEGRPGTVTAEPARSNTITVVSLGEASPLVTELVAQVDGLVSQAEARPFDGESARAILAAKALFAKKRSTMTPEALELGPCLAAELMPGWSADIAHDPRTAADDDPRNMCRAFARGTTRNLVELAPNGDFIQIR